LRHFERRVEAAILGPFPFINTLKVVALAERHRIPMAYPNCFLAFRGGLMSYGANLLASMHQVGFQYVARILKGDKPADLPVQQSTKLELIINLKTANTWYRRAAHVARARRSGDRIAISRRKKVGSPTFASRNRD
jgi:ABC transporter substrate binding protein